MATYLRMVGRLAPRLPAMLFMLRPACQWSNTSSASRTVTLLLAIRSCPASFNVCWTKHATSSFRCAPGWVNYLKNEVGHLLENPPFRVGHIRGNSQEELWSRISARNLLQSGLRWPDFLAIDSQKVI